MKEAIERYWTSYFYTGSIALIVSWMIITLSGCRFGNHEDDGPQTDMKASGYYATTPQSLTFTITPTSGAPTTVSENLNLIPSSISAMLTNPAMVYLIDAQNSFYAIFPYTSTTIPNESLLMEISGGTITWAQDLTPGTWTVPWPNTNCTQSAIVTGTGLLAPTTSSDPTTVVTALGTATLKGHVHLQATLLISHDGDCSAAMPQIQACYNALADCPGNTPADQSDYQLVVQGIYQPFVLHAGLNPNSIATTQSVQYNIVYQ